MSGGEYGQTPGRWFNDRRFNLTSPVSRIRRNVQQMVTDVQQVAEQNPELLGRINQQLQLLTQLSSGAGAQNQEPPLPPLPPPPASPPAQLPDPPLPPPFHRSVSQPSPSQDVQRALQQANASQVVLDMDSNVFSPGSSTGFGTEEWSPPTLPRAEESVASPSDGLSELGAQLAFDSSDDETVSEAAAPEPAPPAAPEGGDDWRRLLELLQSPEMRVYVGLFLRALPYVCLFCAKLFLQHFWGLFSLLILFLVQLFVNRLLTHYVAQRQSGRRYDLVKVALTLGLWISLFFALTMDESLWRVPAFLSSGLDPESNDHVDLSNVLWVVLVSDILASYLCVLAKLPFAAVPTSRLCLRRKGRWYQFMEYSGLAWRHWIPLRPWAAYFLTAPAAATRIGRGFHTCLFFGYVFTKVVHFLPKMSLWRESLSGVLSGGSVGTRASQDDCVKAAHHCSICYSTFTQPLKLSCKHIFCSECIGQWLEREATCPMCRATVTDNPKWRNGATSLTPQLF